MKILVIIFAFSFYSANAQKDVELTQNGWLLYNKGYCLSFFPIKDQSKTPTYKNFFTEEKGDGQIMQGLYTAPPKLLIAKKHKIKNFRYDYNKNKYYTTGKFQFYIQPVQLKYSLNSIAADTLDFEKRGCFWTFLINNQYSQHNAYYFSERRSPEIFFLNKKDSIYAQNGGRRKDIIIDPPH